MNTSLKGTGLRALGLLAIMIIICGVLYTGVMTGLTRLLFPSQTTGSVITVDGVTYGSALIGQPFTASNHLWGRPEAWTAIQGDDGTLKLYGAPTNISPGDDAYGAEIKERVARIAAAHPDQGSNPVPVDLVTGSGSGLDPEISVAAARYQVGRLNQTTGKSAAEINEMIDKCTRGKFLGIFGEKTVNVLKVNLMLDGILK
ncbi:K+-transporting ATPase ATPase C chain [Eubacterium barkeri]|uniref:Potassium-transporting ATPase KdpC subunit n=2 Tax=Eubacterium barkeri TaxID=1528 RepID=A0A1H3EXY0_EUBBA|nr:potassium-transporting ATPase subunit C [Eubacterium barkeri]SDX82774.1 K+-transporting ATPase ATPase C chain [Eubacterium barkeri]